MTQTATILIDIQNDYFAAGLMPLDGMEAAAGNAARLLADARQRKTPVFHIRHIAGAASAPFFRPDTAGSEIHDAVRPKPGEAVIVKNRPSAFVGTDLEVRLRAAHITHLTLCGAMSQMCIDATARAAVDLGFDVTVVEDACAAAQVRFNGIDVPSKQVHAAIMAPLAASYTQIVTTHNVLTTRDAA